MHRFNIKEIQTIKMKLFVPKSHRIKHKILEFLSKERMKNGGLNQTRDYTFCLKEISIIIGEKYEDVYSISDYLFYKKLVNFVNNDKEIENPYCWVSDTGIELFSSFSLINDGKLLNANPLGVIICSKINGLDIGQDTEIQYLDVVKQTNIYVKYSEKLF